MGLKQGEALLIIDEVTITKERGNTSNIISTLFFDWLADGKKHKYWPMRTA